MTKKLKISDTLSLPIDAATQTFAFLARKGAGKTYAAGKLAELLLEAGVQVVVLDSVGNWFGLRLGADGKSKGFDIPVLGGLRGDLQLEPEAGALIADTLVDTGRSAVIDVSQFSKEGRRRFATAFAERLWSRKKAERHPSPLHLVIEESQLIVPQQVDAGAARMVGIYEEIIRLGRNYGIGVSMISQRPQSVNKEVLTQTECLFVMQTNGKQERQAIKDWVVAQGIDVNLVNELPSLPIGTAYVWSPQWLGVLERVKIAPKKTYDSSSTPKVGERKRTVRDPAPLDLDDLRERMKDVVERAKADDPRELRKRIAELEKAKPAPAPAAQPKRIEVPALKPADRKAIERSIAKMAKLYAGLDELVEKVTDKLAGIAKTAGNELRAERVAATDVINKLHGLLHPAAPSSVIVGVKPQRGVQVFKSLADAQRAMGLPIERSPIPARVEAGPGDASVGAGGLRRILIALAQRPQGLTNRQIGLRAGLSSQSGTFSTYLSRARQAGWVEDQGDVRRITDAGVKALGSYDPLPTGAALLDHWLGELGQSGAARILRACADAYPKELSNEEIGAAAGISAASGTFSTYMSKLRGLELIEGQRGRTRASEELFA